MKNGAFFLKENFVFRWGLRPRPNLPRPWAGPVSLPQSCLTTPTKELTEHSSPRCMQCKV